jgi:hypothetical protein
MPLSRLLLALVFLVSALTARANDDARIVLNELLLRLKPDVNAAEYFGAELPNAKGLIAGLNIYQLKIDAPTDAAVLAEVERRKADPRVEWAEPNMLVRIIIEPPVNSPIVLPPANPPIFVVLGPLAGRYLGTVTVQKTLAVQELSDKYRLRAQARVADGKITILTSSNQGPGSVSELGSEPAVEVVLVAVGENNCLVDGRYPGRLTIDPSGFQIRYAISPGEGLSNKVPLTSFEFKLRKR